MLVLSRRKGEATILETAEGVVIRLTVEGARGPVRLGFEAPRSVAIFREEVAGRPGTPPPAGH
jgi:carbon storage regulator CsrA